MGLRLGGRRLRIKTDHHQEAVFDRAVAVEVEALVPGGFDRVAELDAHCGFVEDTDEDVLVLGDALGDRQVFVLVADLAFDHPDLLQRDAAFAGGVGPVDDSLLKDGMAGVDARIDHSDQGSLAQRAAVCPLAKLGQLDVLDRNEQGIEIQFSLFGQLGLLASAIVRKRRHARFQLQGLDELPVDDLLARQVDDQERNIVPNSQVRIVHHLAACFLDQIRRLARVFHFDQQRLFGEAGQRFLAVEQGRRLGAGNDGEQGEQQRGSEHSGRETGHGDSLKIRPVVLLKKGGGRFGIGGRPRYRVNLTYVTRIA